MSYYKGSMLKGPEISKQNRANNHEPYDNFCNYWFDTIKK